MGEGAVFQLIVQLITLVGLPTALLILFGIALQRKWLHTNATVEAKDERIKDLKDQLEQVQAQKAAAQDVTKQTLSTLNQVLRLTQGLVLRAVRSPVDSDEFNE